MEVKKSFAVMNLAYRDKTRTDDYLLERVQGRNSMFSIPLDMQEFQYMYASDLTELICQDALREQETDKYTKQELDNILQDLRFEILSMLI